MMGRSGMFAWSLCVALTLQSASGFVVSPFHGSSTSTSSSSSSRRSLFHRNQPGDTPKQDVNAPAVVPSPATTNTRFPNKSKYSTPKITEIKSVDDFGDFLTQDDRLCVVKFHASWCKSCQKFGVKFRKLGLQLADTYNVHTHNDDGQLDQQKGQVRLASVEFSANASLCRALEIKKLPFVHIYKGGVGKIDGFSCGPSKFPMLVDKLNAYLQMTNEELRFEKNMADGEELGNAIVKELKQDQQQQQPLSSLKESSAKRQ